MNIQPLPPGALPPGGSPLQPPEPTGAPPSPLSDQVLQPAGPPRNPVSSDPVPVVDAANAFTEAGVFTVEVNLPGNRKVTMRQPNIATQLFVGKIMGALMAEGSPPDYLLRVVKAMMYVTKIDGDSVERPRDHVELAKVMNRLGDTGVDLVCIAFQQNFGALINLPKSGPQ